MTSGFERFAGGEHFPQGCASSTFRSSWMNMRQTVGGAHSEVTLLAAILSSMSRALNRG